MAHWGACPPPDRQESPTQPPRRPPRPQPAPSPHGRSRLGALPRRPTPNRLGSRTGMPGARGEGRVLARGRVIPAITPPPSHGGVLRVQKAKEKVILSPHGGKRNIPPSSRWEEMRMEISGQARIHMKTGTPTLKTIPPALKMPRATPRERGRKVERERARVTARVGGGEARVAPPPSIRDA